MTDHSANEAPGTRQIVRVILLSLLLVMLFGAIVGFMSEHIRQGGGPLSLLPGLIMAGIALAFAWVGWTVVADIVRLFRHIGAMPRREQVTVRILAISMLAGAVTGVAVVLGPARSDWLLGARGAMPPAVAIAITLPLLTLGPWFTWRWWRAIDEHEKAAYVEGANIAGHFTLFAGIAWWVLDRAALVPPPDVMVLVLATSFVWSAVWFYRKFY